MRQKNEEKWETPSLEWIHRVREQLAKEQPKGPMPLTRQKALAAKWGLKLVGPWERTGAR